MSEKNKEHDIFKDEKSLKEFIEQEIDKKINPYRLEIKGIKEGFSNQLNDISEKVVIALKEAKESKVIAGAIKETTEKIIGYITKLKNLIEQ